MVICNLGKGSVEKSRLLSSIAWKSETPHPPIRATWSFFSGRQNDVLRVWKKNSFYDDNGDCNNNYDSNGGNNNDKKDQKTYK